MSDKPSVVEAMKDCRICGGVFPLSAMTKDKKSADGRMRRCKRCSSDVTKRWLASNPDRAREINAASKERNRERAKQQRRDRWAALANDPEHRRLRHRRQIAKRYNVNGEWWEAMMRRQGGRCAICGIPATDVGRAFSVDHDHSCCPGATSCGRCVRGLLCGPCNLTLHAMEKRPDWIDRASAYLTEHRTVR